MQPNLAADGSVVAWGYNSNGHTNVPGGLTNVAAIAAGFSHSLASKADGTLVAWGDSTYNQTNIPAGLANAVKIAGGGYHNLVLESDGRPSLTVQPLSQVAAAGMTARLLAMAVALGCSPTPWLTLKPTPSPPLPPSCRAPVHSAHPSDLASLGDLFSAGNSTGSLRSAPARSASTPPAAGVLRACCGRVAP